MHHQRGGPTLLQSHIIEMDLSLPGAAMDLKQKVDKKMRITHRHLRPPPPSSSLPAVEEEEQQRQMRRPRPHLNRQQRKRRAAGSKRRAY